MKRLLFIILAVVCWFALDRLVAANLSRYSTVLFAFSLGLLASILIFEVSRRRLMR